MGNLLLLCRHHHRLVHEGGYRVDPRGRFYHPSGRRLPAVPSLPRGSPLELVERLEPLRINETMCESATGHPMDLVYAVDALLSVAGVPE